MTDASISFTEVQRALARAHSVADAAEAHGTLAGALCALQPYTLDNWLSEILPEGRAAPAEAARLRALYDATSLALRAEQMGFEPLLPGDDEPLQDRTAALGEWCQGFLYGLGTGKLRDIGSLSGDTAEILRDLTEITHVDVDPADGAENNESAYAELVEFVRVGVQLLFEQLEPLRSPESAPPAASLH
jgi:uncharacterized protein